jgi:hypothetical protein
VRCAVLGDEWLGAGKEGAVNVENLTRMSSRLQEQDGRQRRWEQSRTSKKEQTQES